MSQPRNTTSELQFAARPVADVQVTSPGKAQHLLQACEIRSFQEGEKSVTIRARHDVVQGGSIEEIDLN